MLLKQNNNAGNNKQQEFDKKKHCSCLHYPAHHHCLPKYWVNVLIECGCVPCHHLTLSCTLAIFMQSSNIIVWQLCPLVFHLSLFLIFCKIVVTSFFFCSSLVCCAVNDRSCLWLVVLFFYIFVRLLLLKPTKNRGKIHYVLFN